MLKRVNRLRQLGLAGTMKQQGKLADSARRRIVGDIDQSQRYVRRPVMDSEYGLELLAKERWVGHAGYL